MNSSNIYEILNLYSFVKTEKNKSDQEYVEQRLWEYNLMRKQRNAVSFCKKLTVIKLNDLSQITNEDKERIEGCLRENFLSKDPNYFGRRDTIFLDLHNYY
jgi:hypothetical protein